MKNMVESKLYHIFTKIIRRGKTHDCRKKQILLSVEIETFLFFEKAAAFCGNAAGVAAKEEKVPDS